MPGARRTRKGQTQVGKNAEIKRAGPTPNGVQSFDGRSNMQAGTKPTTAGERGEMDVQSKPVVIDTA